MHSCPKLYVKIGNVCTRNPGRKSASGCIDRQLTLPYVTIRQRLLTYLLLNTIFFVYGPKVIDN